MVDKYGILIIFVIALDKLTWYFWTRRLDICDENQESAMNIYESLYKFTLELKLEVAKLREEVDQLKGKSQ